MRNTQYPLESLDQALANDPGYAIVKPVIAEVLISKCVPYEVAAGAIEVPDTIFE